MINVEENVIRSTAEEWVAGRWHIRRESDIEIPATWGLIGGKEVIS